MVGMVLWVGREGGIIICIRPRRRRAILKVQRRLSQLCKNLISTYDRNLTLVGVLTCSWQLPRGATIVVGSAIWNTGIANRVVAHQRVVCGEQWRRCKGFNVSTLRGSGGQKDVRTAWA